MRRASSRPEITSIGKPSTWRASRRNCGAFFATRSALVPTARTAWRGKPRSRSANLASASSAARLRGAVDALVGGEAAAQAHHLAHRVERIDLAVDHAADLAGGSCSSRGRPRRACRGVPWADRITLDVTTSMQHCIRASRR
jgi:hypothetical protein